MNEFGYAGFIRFGDKEHEDVIAKLQASIDEFAKSNPNSVARVEKMLGCPLSPALLLFVTANHLDRVTYKNSKDLFPEAPSGFFPSAKYDDLIDPLYNYIPLHPSLDEALRLGITIEDIKQSMTWSDLGSRDHCRHPASRLLEWIRVNEISISAVHKRATLCGINPSFFRNYVLSLRSVSSGGLPIAATPLPLSARRISGFSTPTSRARESKCAFLSHLMKSKINIAALMQGAAVRKPHVGMVRSVDSYWWPYQARLRSRTFELGAAEFTVIECPSIPTALSKQKVFTDYEAREAFVCGLTTNVTDSEVASMKKSLKSKQARVLKHAVYAGYVFTRDRLLSIDASFADCVGCLDVMARPSNNAAFEMVKGFMTSFELSILRTPMCLPDDYVLADGSGLQDFEVHWLAYSCCLISDDLLKFFNTSKAEGCASHVYLTNEKYESHGVVFHSAELCCPVRPGDSMSNMADDSLFYAMKSFKGKVGTCLTEKKLRLQSLKLVSCEQSESIEGGEAAVRDAIRKIEKGVDCPMEVLSHHRANRNAIVSWWQGAFCSSAKQPSIIDLYIMSIMTHIRECSVRHLPYGKTTVSMMRSVAVNNALAAFHIEKIVEAEKNFRSKRAGSSDTASASNASNFVVEILTGFGDVADCLVSYINTLDASRLMRACKDFWKMNVLMTFIPKIFFASTSLFPHRNATEYGSRHYAIVSKQKKTHLLIQMASPRAMDASDSYYVGDASLAPSRYFSSSEVVITLEHHDELRGSHEVAATRPNDEALVLHRHRDQVDPSGHNVVDITSDSYQNVVKVTPTVLSSKFEDAICNSSMHFFHFNLKGEFGQRISKQHSMAILRIKNSIAASSCTRDDILSTQAGGCREVAMTLPVFVRVEGFISKLNSILRALQPVTVSMETQSFPFVILSRIRDEHACEKRTDYEMRSITNAARQDVIEVLRTKVSVASKKLKREPPGDDKTHEELVAIYEKLLREIRATHAKGSRKRARAEG